MSDEHTTPNNEELENINNEGNNEASEQNELATSDTKITHLGGMYQEWFLDYASYVILERAVPHINDGLKPVQRRILHAMRRMDDGRYNKVANIIGFTMQFHPHGDASIGDALVQLGQKDLLIDTQGNWGNVATGDGAAAPRYIEARLTKFAQEVVFNPKTTNWKLSYDGRNKEPITLPVKFPLLLTQGVEGIAVGLASKILPHNFNELIDASIAYLQDKPFEIFPDFATGGMIDVSRYNDGARGGAVKVRAKIIKEDNKTLNICDIPFGKNTSSLIESIIKANDKGKIKIKKIDDNTSDKVEILIHLPNNVSTDKTIDALYAFTDCEISISPNCCLIEDNKPKFVGVSSVLRQNTDHTVELLTRELEIRLSELEEAWHKSSLEKIFIEERMYKEAGYENSESKDEAIDFLDKCFEPWKPKFRREINRDDLTALFEIKMGRILKFNSDKANDYIKGLDDEMVEVKNHLENIIPYTIAYYKHIKKTFGKDHPRMTEIRSFENIEASKVVVKNEKLFINRDEGFMGTSLRKDEFVCDCSDIDDIILFYKDGRYLITKVSDKAFVGKGIMHLAVFKKSDTRTIYNVAYRDGKKGTTYVKRFAVTGITRDKEYNVTKGTVGSDVLYFSANPNGEAEVLKVILRPKARVRNLVFDYDMAELAIKGRGAMGNILSKYEVQKVALRKKGVSTLGGRKIWFDKDVLRLNSDSRGDYLGEFHADDSILVITKSGEFYHTSFDLTNHYEDDIHIIEKFNPDKVWSVAFYDGDQKYFYIKRFQLEASNKKQSFIGEHAKSYLVQITEVDYPRLEVKFGGDDKERENVIVEVEEFIGVKSFKARGKRLSTYQVSKINELEPIRQKEVEPEPEKPTQEDDEDQMNLFEQQ